MHSRESKHDKDEDYSGLEEMGEGVWGKGLSYRLLLIIMPCESLIFILYRLSNVVSCLRTSKAGRCKPSKFSQPVLNT